MNTEIVNVEMAKAWDGDEGAHWAEHAERYDAVIGAYGRHLLETAALSAGEDVLDIGCGNGASSLDAARACAPGRAVGIDLSTAMLERARQRAEAMGLDNVTFERGDAQVYGFNEAFDVVISRFGALFFTDPVAAFSNIGSAVRTGGRLAMLAWQGLDENEWVAAARDSLAAGRELPLPPPHAPGPFGLADADHVRRVLSEGGFTDVALADVREAVVFGGDVNEAFAFLRGVGFVRGLLEDLDDEAAEAALKTLRVTLAAHETGDGVAFNSAAWLITARRS